MIKKKIFVSMMLFMLVTGLGLADWSNDFDNLQFNLAYSNLLGQIDLRVHVQDIDLEKTLEIPLVPDMPGVMIQEWIDSLCDETNPDYQPQMCAFAQQVFNDDVIAQINAQWNGFLDAVLDLMPQTLVTRQLPWPANMVGSIRFDDNPWEWPCTWDPDTGEFSAVPIDVPLYQGVFQDINWVVSVSGDANGLIDRNNNYSLAGHFTAGGAFQAESTSLNVHLGFSISGDFSERHMLFDVLSPQ